MLGMSVGATSDIHREGIVDKQTLTLLLDEHRILLSSIRYSRLISRLALASVAIIQQVFVYMGRSSSTVILCTGILMAVAWSVDEFSTARRVRQIESLVAKDDADLQNVNLLVQLRHESWRNRHLINIIRAEGLIWLVLLISQTLLSK